MLCIFLPEVNMEPTLRHCKHLVAEYLLKPINERQLIELLKRMALDIIGRQHPHASTVSEQEQDVAQDSYSEHVKMLKDYIQKFY